MKNFETHFPTDGTAALQSRKHNERVIIQFPSHRVSRVFSAEQQKRQGRGAALLTRSATVHEIKYGTAKGKAFDRFSKFHVVLSGTALSCIAFASVFFNL